MGFIEKARNVFSGEETVIHDPILRSIINGDALTRDKAMSLPQVASDVDIITSTVAFIPIRLYKKQEEDGRTQVVAIDDPRVKMLNRETNDTLDGFQFKKAMAEDYLMSKGGYAYILRERNKVKGLYYVKSEHVYVLRNDDPIFKRAMYYVNSKTYFPHEFIKVMRNTRDGIKGTGVVDEINDALNTSYSMLKYQLNLMKKGGNKKGFLKSDRKLSEPAINELKRAWTKLNSNENSDNVVVLNQGLEFQESSNNAAQMQLNQSITTLNQEIDKIFHFSDDYEKFIKNAVQPICTAFETALNRDLLLEREKDDYFFAFDYSEVLRANMKERFESYKLAKEAGWITKNEIREMEHLKTYKGLDIIDVGLGSTNYNPVKDEWFVPNTGQMTNSDDNTSSSKSSGQGDDGNTKGGE